MHVNGAPISNKLATECIINFHEEQRNVGPKLKMKNAILQTFLY